MKNCVTADGKAFVHYTEEERARRAGQRQKARRKGNPAAGHPSTAEIDYSEREWEFMKAVGDFQNRTGRKFPTWREVYHVFIALGYEKAPADEAGAEVEPDFAMN
jgi:hypothetical protein